MGQYVFEACKGLKTLVLGPNFNKIDEGWLNGTESVTFEFNGENPYYTVMDSLLCDKRDPDNWIAIYYPPANTRPFTIGGVGERAEENMTFNDGGNPEEQNIDLSKVTQIYKRSFPWTYAEKITIGPNVKVIGEDAFYQSYAKEFELLTGSQLETIEKEAFYRCNGINNLNLPNTLKTIGESAFEGCKNMESVTIDGSVNSIGKRAFAESSALKTFTFNGTPQFTEIAEACFQNDTLLEKFDVPVGVTKIQNSAFNGCKHMTDVILPEGLTSISTNAFQHCAFKEIDLPNTLVTIGNEAFNSCDQLETVHIHRGTTYVGPQAFMLCNKLTGITVSDDNPVYAGVDGMLSTKDHEKLLLFPAGKAREDFTLLSPAFQEIGDSAFFGCKNLKNIVIPRHVTRIGRSAFQLCDNLESISFRADKAITQADTYETLREKIWPFILEGDTVYNRDGIPSYEFEITGDPVWGEGVYKKDSEGNDIKFDENGDPISPRRWLENAKIDVSGDTVYVTRTIREEVKDYHDMGKKVLGDLDADGIPEVVKHQMERGEKFHVYVDRHQKDAYNDATKSIFANNPKLADYLEIRYSFKQSVDADKQYKGEEYIEKEDEIADYNEYFPYSNTVVGLVDVERPNADLNYKETLVIPETIESPITGKKYQVEIISDYAFHDTPDNMDEVVLMGNIEYLGARAFRRDESNGKSTIKNIFFAGATSKAPHEMATVRFDLNNIEDKTLHSEYNEFNDEQKIYVRKSLYEQEGFLDAMGAFKDQTGYKIPLPMTSQSGTFAREFDVDFSDLRSDNKEYLRWPKVIAYIAGTYRERGVNSGSYEVYMTCINPDNADTIINKENGTYIPANTGVVLRAIEGSAPDFYYRIHEEHLSLDGQDNIMVGVTEKERLVGASDGDFTNFLLSGGTLHKMTVSRTFPRHKAYLQIPTNNLPADGKLNVVFDDGTITQIDIITGEIGDDSQGAYYNLQGARMNGTPVQKGVYIRDGKKIVVR